MHPKKPTDVAAQVAALWTEHHQRLARTVARKAITSPTDPMVEDSLTETMIRVIRFLARGGEIHGEPLNFLATIAWREYLRLTATAARTRRNDRQAWDDELDTDDPQDVVLDGLAVDLDGALEQALARLTPRQRAVLTDNHAGYTYNEIADRHGISWTGVNKAIQRARHTLRHDGRLSQAYREWSD